MKVQFDTNICLDVLMNRPQFFQNSFDAIVKGFGKGIKPFITTATVMDIMYISRKSFPDFTNQLKAVESLCNKFNLIKVDKKDLDFAFSGVLKDFEDAVQSSCAKRKKIDFIITRNVKDFSNSPVKAITPEEFLSL